MMDIVYNRVNKRNFQMWKDKSPAMECLRNEESTSNQDQEKVKPIFEN